MLLPRDGTFVGYEHSRWGPNDKRAAFLVFESPRTVAGWCRLGAHSTSPSIQPSQDISSGYECRISRPELAEVSLSGAYRDFRIGKSGIGRFDLDPDHGAPVGGFWECRLRRVCGIISKHGS